MKHPRLVLAVSLSAVLASTTIVGPLLRSAQLDAATVSLTRGPYLQMGTPSSVVVRWRSNGASDSIVQYGPDPATLTASVTLAALTTEHQVTVSGLTPNTRYYYAIGSTTQRLAGGDANHSFVTSPVSGAALPTRVWVLGDSGTADENAAAVRNAYYSFTGSTAPNLWLMLGDNAYNGGTDSEYQNAVFDMYPATLRQSVLWPTIGNHDVANTAQGTGPYYDIFTLPKSGQAGGLASGTEAYYSFDYANIHFVCLDSFDVDLTAGSPMMTWLQNDVASTTQRWTIAFWHHPPYSKGSHDSDVDYELTQMRQNALPILEAAGVDLVLAGHSHSYERSFLIDGHYGRSNTFTASMKKNGGSGRADGTGAYLKPAAGSAPHAGAVYTVAGSSGFADAGFPLNHPAMFISMAVMGSLVLDVNDGRLDAKFIDNTSTVRDYFSIIKGSATPLSVSTTSLPGGTAGTPYSQTLAATGGLTPYTWSLAAGSLPAGLSLNAGTGAITGTPTATGAPMFTVQVRDSSAPNVTAERQLSISIVAPPVAVPNVVSLTQAAATTAITGAGLVVGTVTTAPSAIVPAGSVISQNPTGGTQVTLGSAVSLVVSTGAALVSVPSVVSLTQAAAATALASAGLTLGTVTTAPSASVPVGSVISQNPGAGSQIAAGSPVALVVSTGVTVPSVVGLTQAAATSLIASVNGLTVGAITTASSATVAAGSVISQSPAGNTNVSGGSSVALVVSSGPPSLKTVPNVVTLTQANAVAAIANAGLTAGTMTAAASPTVPAGSVISQSPAAGSQITAGSPVDLVVSIGVAAPVVIGSQIGGTFADTTGHSAQSHLVYAANAGVWWLFTLTSTADSTGGSNHVVKSYRSSGPDLATSTWTAAADSPGAAASASSNCGSCSMGGGRALGVAYINNAPTDVVHAELAMAFNGQNGLTSHIRATVTATTINWEPWNYFDRPAASWTLPRAVALGVSSGKFIHSGGPTLQQEVDANARKSNAPDTGATWTSGFSAVSLIDNSMLHESNAIAFAPLANNAMVAIYDDGGGQSPCYNCGGTGVPEPNLSNLGFKRSNADGSWPTVPVGSQGSGDGRVFSTAATIDQNDWALVPLDTTTIRAFRSNAAGTGIDASGYDSVTNTWAAVPSPPLFGPDQSFKRGAGLFGATDGSNIWLFVVNNDTANSILYTTYRGATWTVWRAVPGTDIGQHVRNFISGYPIAANNRVGLIWTEGTTQRNVFTTSLSADVIAPVVSLLAPAGGSTVFDSVSVMATASDNVGLNGVQFQIDGTNQGPPQFTPPYGLIWDSTTVTNGSHSIAVIASDAEGNSSSDSVTVTVSNLPTRVVPSVINLTQAAAAAALTSSGLTLGTVSNAASASVPIGSVISQSPAPGSEVAVHSSVDLVVSIGVTVPQVVGLTQVAATSIIASIDGLTIGAITTAPSTTVAAGLVLSQNPGGNTNVSGGSSVALVVSSGPPLVSVPVVVNLTQAAAATAITSASLVVGTVSVAASATVPSGSVISQNPAGGTQAPSGSAVDLIVSTGPPPVSVPDVVNLTQAAATTAITGAGLVIGTVGTASSVTVPAGTVISQTPVGGTQAASGSAVNLVVSSGPLVSVPNVVNLIQATAATTITGAGLVVGTVSNASSATVPPGAVISQTPVGGTQVESGSIVNLVVSTGPPLVAVPNVVNQTQAAATTAITGAGLVLGTVTNAASATVPAGSVISQTPVGGTQVATGSAVNLVVSTGPPLVAVPNVVNQTQAAATTAITGAGLVLGTVTNAASATVPAGSVISQTPVGGTQVATGSAVNLVVSTGPPLVAVPNVVNQTQAAATTAITGAGLVLGTVTNAASATVPAGSVISQTPVGGTQVATGSAVNLVVSTGPPLVAVPNVVNQTQAAATTAIAGAGLVLGTVTNAASATVPAGSVISQTPVGGTQVATGSAVNLVVSTGPPLVAVPNVVNQTQAAATTAITGAGLVLGTVTNAASATVPAGSVISQTPVGGIMVTPGSAVSLVVSTGAAAVSPPIAIGTQIAGTFADATGHSAQSHLVYAANAGVWWMFTLTSGADAQGGTNHLVKAYRSSGSNLATATWTAATDSPGAATASSTNCSSCFMGDGRALSVAYVNNTPTDVVHAEVAMASDGQNGLVGHIRATVTATSITWAAWNYRDEGAGTWTRPRAGALGVSTGKYIQSGGPILNQELWANARRSTNPDTSATWTTGFSGVSIIDDTMIHASNAMAFAPLANNVMLAVYDDGGGVSSCYHCGEPGVPEPNLTNLRYKKSGATGSWAAGSGDGQVFTTAATIDQNDWALVARDTTTIHAFRRKATGTGIDAAVYNAGTNTWANFTAPPLFGAGQSFKAGAGLFGASAGSNIWLFVVNTDAANSILYTTYNGTSWSPWAAVPGTDIGTHTRQFISGSSGASQVGLIWTEGTTQYNVFVTNLSTVPGVAVPNVVSQTQAAATTAITGAGLVLGTVTNAASATVPAGSVISQTPVGGTQVATGSAVNLVVSTGPALVAVPNVVSQTQAAATTAITGAGLALGTVTNAASATVPAGSVISQTPVGGTQVATGSAVNLVVSTGPALVAVPNVVSQTQAAATTAITGAGLIVGTVTNAASTTVPAGSVISQTPVGGTQVATGSAVNLVISTGPALVAVPDVVTQTQAAATTAITGAGLVLGTVTNAASATVPAGSVISQTPVGGTQVATGSAVNLVVSTGPALVAVPNVVSQTQAAATTAITGAGLVLGTVTNAASATVPAGSVISQTPVGGTQVATGSAVNLVISTGPALVAVPDVVSQTQAAATTAITGAGLIVGTVTNAASATVPAGSVISQTPVGGTQVATGSAVNLVISTGPALVAVPDVVSQTQAAATTAITGAGLIVGTVTNAASATVPAGSVISQTPVGGTQVATGSAVNLVISTGPALVAVPDVVSQTQAAATTAITGAGLIVGTVTNAASATVPAGSVISQTPVGGTQVATGSAVNFVVSTGPPLVAVPNVVSQTQAAAGTAITGAGLVVGTVTNAASATVPAGSVISQTPVGGTQVATGSAVNLVVSTGPPLVAVPNVVSQTQTAATTAITGAGLVVGTVTNASSATVPAGSVISQTPVGGTQVATGSAVNLVVSTGPPLVAVPNVVSQTQAAATTAITGAGLVLGTVTNAASATVPAGSVISQTPVGGTQVATGSAVNLVVSTGPPLVAVPNVVSQTQAAATTAITGAGLVLGTVTNAASATVPAGSVISQTPVGGTQVATGSAVNLVVSIGAAVTPPIAIGSQIAGTFADATGHSGQSHLVYAANAGVWWLFTLTSSADSQGGTNHLVKAYRSSGPDLATATWTAATDSPGASAASSAHCPNCSMGGGRSLSVAYINNAPADVVHAEVAMASNGQNGLTGHIRAKVTATSITWDSWNYRDEDATTWSLPRTGALGVSTGKFVHSGGATLQQQMNANVRLSSNADTGSTWVNGFSNVSVVDNNLTNQSNSMAFAALAGNAMLVVYDNGGGTGVSEPNLSNLRYKKSSASGSWSAGSGDGQVFATAATIDQNDWALVARDTTSIYAFRRRAAGTGIDAAVYNAGTNTWSTFTAPPVFGSGQSFKAGAGVYGASAGSNIWLFVVNTDAANSILYTTYNGTAWSAWAAVPGTDTGTHTRRYISGLSGASQVGLIWTEGTTQYNVFVTRLLASGVVSVPSVVNLTQSAATAALTGAGLVAGTVTNASSATVPAGAVISQTPVGGSQVATGSAVNLVVSTGPPLVAVPNVVNQMQAAATTAITSAGLVVGTVTNASSATVPAGAVISQNPAGGTQAATGSAVALVVSTGAAGSPAVDTLVFSDGIGTRTTPSFSTTAAGAVLVAFAASDGPMTGSQSLTVSGAGLTWTLVQRVNAQAGTAEIWQAKAVGQLSNVTVQSAQSSTGFSQSLTVVAFGGASGVGASAAANAATGAPTVTLVTTRANSLVYGVGNDWEAAIARTVGANQVMVHQLVDTAMNDTMWVQSRNAPVPTAGTSVQLNDTAPTGDRWNFASVEIVP